MADNGQPLPPERAGAVVRQLLGTLVQHQRELRKGQAEILDRLDGLAELPDHVEVVIKQELKKALTPKEDDVPKDRSADFNAVRERIRKGVPGKPDIPLKLALLALVDLDEKALADGKPPDTTDLLAKWDQLGDRLAQELRHPTYKETAALLDAIDQKLADLGSKVDALKPNPTVGTTLATLVSKFDTFPEKAALQGYLQEALRKLNEAEDKVARLEGQCRRLIEANKKMRPQQPA